MFQKNSAFQKSGVRMILGIDLWIDPKLIGYQHYQPPCCHSPSWFNGRRRSEKSSVVLSDAIHSKRLRFVFAAARFIFQSFLMPKRQSTMGVPLSRAGMRSCLSAAFQGDLTLVETYFRSTIAKVCMEKMHWICFRLLKITFSGRI